jgi:SET domain-containing protein
MSTKSSGSRRPFRVGRSKTGLGLFATKLIPKGSFIVRYAGRKLPNRIADELDTKYLFEINSRWTIDGSPRSNIAR